MPCQVVRDAKFDLEAIALASDNDLGPYENILMQVESQHQRVGMLCGFGHPVLENGLLPLLLTSL